MESIKSILFEKFSDDEVKHPEYIKGGARASTYYNMAGKEIGHDNFYRYNTTAGSGSYTDDGGFTRFRTDGAIATGGSNTSGSILGATNILNRGKNRF